jgi:hypothetical protein
MKRTTLAVEAYLDAKHAVVAAGYASEIDWQSALSFSKVDESHFLREAAWAVLLAGFRESVVRARFAAISRAFLEWKSADSIQATRRTCVRQALRVFNHGAKIQAIASIAEQVASRGFASLAEEIKADPLGRLRAFPYIGPVTSCHLAKNLGFNVAKPDRHLVRIAAMLGFASPSELCITVGDLVGEKASVIDVVFWRFATISHDYEHQLLRYGPAC